MGFHKPSELKIQFELRTLACKRRADISRAGALFPVSRSASEALIFQAAKESFTGASSPVSESCSKKSASADRGLETEAGFKFASVKAQPP